MARSPETHARAPVARKNTLPHKVFLQGTVLLLAWSYDAVWFRVVPTIFIEGPYAFRFYSSDQSEPIHIHVVRDNQEAKFWLRQSIVLASNYGFSPREIASIRLIIELRRADIEARWRDHFSEN